jgi:hypothetical protein
MAGLAKCVDKSRIECVHIDMRTSVARQQCKRVRGRRLRSGPSVRSSAAARPLLRLLPAWGDAPRGG